MTWNMTWNPTNLHFAAFTLLEFNRSKLWGFIRTVFCDFTDYSKEITNSNFRLIWTVTHGANTQRRERVSRKKIREEKEPEKREQEERRSPCAKRCKSSETLSVFPMHCSSGGSKTRLAKAVGAEPSLRMCDGSKIARGCGAKHIWKLKCD